MDNQNESESDTGRRGLGGHGALRFLRLIYRDRRGRGGERRVRRLEEELAQLRELAPRYRPDLVIESVADARDSLRGVWQGTRFVRFGTGELPPPEFTRRLQELTAARPSGAKPGSTRCSATKLRPRTAYIRKASPRSLTNRLVSSSIHCGASPFSPSTA